MLEVPLINIFLKLRIGYGKWIGIKNNRATGIGFLLPSSTLSSFIVNFIRDMKDEINSVTGILLLGF